MKCGERKDLLSLYALGALEGAEKEELRQHLQTGCPTCVGRLAEAHAILALMPAATSSPVPVPANARDRILALTQPSHISSSSNLSQAYGWLPNNIRISERPTLRIGSGLIGAALAASVALLLFLNISIKYRKSLDKYNALTLTQQQELIGLREQIKAGAPVNRRVSWPSAQFAMLRGAGPQAEAGGMLLWDPSNKSYCFCADKLRNLPDGKTYELWLINSDQKKIACGTFQVDSHGSAKFKNTLGAADPGSIVATAVTDEPWGGMAQPTGSIQLVGDVN